MTKKTSAIQRNVDTSNSLKRERSKKFYHTRKWRNLRKAKKEKDRARDFEQAVDFYEAHSHISSFDLDRFMESGMPMCEECKRNDKLSPAYYLDHINRIRAGGSKDDEDNLQWLCKTCDAIKRSEEGRE